MTPKEKAEELINKYILNTPVGFHFDDAKRCSLIAVDEILKEVDDYFLHQHCATDRYFFWKEVKQEIEKI